MKNNKDRDFLIMKIQEKYLKKLSTEKLKQIFILCYAEEDKASESGDYIPFSENHEPLWDERTHFKIGDSFPDDRSWVLASIIPEINK